MTDYSETLLEMQKTMREIDSMTRCPAADDHERIAQAATHLLKRCAELYAVAKLNAEMAK